jgi:hypothetical protein
MRPELTLGCFYGQKFLGNSIKDIEIYYNPKEEACRKRNMSTGPHWDVCSKYLTFAQIKINPFTEATIE